MTDAWVACDALIDESWNRFRRFKSRVLCTMKRLTASPYRVYVYKVGSREVVCEWDGESATLSIYPSWYEPPTPPENIP